MAANRTIYLLCLSAAVAFYAAETFTTDSPVWFAWVVLFTVLVLPVLSLLLSLAPMLALRVRMDAPEYVEQGTKLGLRLSVQALRVLPLPPVRVRLGTETLGSRELAVRQLHSLPRTGGTVWIETNQPGTCRVRMTRLRVYDYLGLIWLPKRRCDAVRTAVLPVPLAPKPMPDLTMLQALRLVALPQGSFSEDHDYRPYREGDNVRSIHWKLSQKTEELIVREPVAPEQLRCYVLVEPATRLAALQSELAQLRYLSAWLAAHRLHHTVLWCEESGLRSRVVAAPDGVLPMLVDVCASPVFSDPAPRLSEPEADWYCRIRPEEEVRP